MTDRQTRAGLARIVTSEVAGMAYAGSHTFVVSAVHAGGRCDLTPEAADRFQPLASVDQWPGVGGAVVTPVVGSIAVVEFRDWRSDRPMIVRFQPKRLDGGTPELAELDADAIELAGGGPAAARAGDACGQLFVVDVPGGATALWYRPADGDAYVLVASSPLPPTSSTPGTPIYIVEGSAKVTIG